MSGNKLYLDILAHLVIFNSIKSIAINLEKLEDKIFKGVAITTKRKFKQNNPRRLKRAEMYAKKPELYFYNRLLEMLFHAKANGLHKKLIKDDYDKSISLLKYQEFEDLYCNNEVIFNIGSFAVNSVYYLDDLNINKDIKDKFIQELCNFYFDNDQDIKVKLNKWDYWTFIYSLTHIIIGESRFYQNYVDNHLWVTEYFSKNIKEIVDRCNPDIVAEVGLCIKLTKEVDKYNLAMTIIDDYLFNNYDFELMLSDNMLEKKEHTNAIITLLFYDNNQWFEGPDLSSKFEFLYLFNIMDKDYYEKRNKFIKLRPKYKSYKYSRGYHFAKQIRKLMKRFSRR